MSQDTNLFLISSLLFVFHDTIGFCEKGVILSHSYVIAGKDAGPFLANQDTSRLDPLPAEPLDTQALACAVSAISGTSPCFFVRHDVLLKIWNVGIMENWNIGKT